MKLPAATIALCGFVITAAAAVTFVGCSEATAGLEDVSEVVGVYDLKTVDGGPPPERLTIGVGEIDGMPIQVFTTEVFQAILTLENHRRPRSGGHLCCCCRRRFTLCGNVRPGPFVCAVT